jgi:cell division protein FtsB
MTEKQLVFRVKALTAAAIVFICSLLLYILIQFVILSNLNASEQRLNSQLEYLKTQADTLEEEIDYRNSRTYIEQYARENLGLGYSNETKYIVNEE